MNRLARSVEILVGVMIVVVLSVILFVTFGNAPETTQLSPMVEPSPVAATAYPVVESLPAKPYPSPLEPAPTSESSYPPLDATPVARPSLPVCDFTESSPDPAGISGKIIDRFGAPQLVQALVTGIRGWIDDQHMLVMYEQHSVSENSLFKNSFHELNLATGEMRTYVNQGTGILNHPVWITSTRAIAYFSTTMIDTDNSQMDRFRADLLVTFVDSEQTILVASDVIPTLALAPDSQRLWYFLRTDPLQPYIYDVQLNTSQPAPFHLSSFLSPKPDLEWIIHSDPPLFKLAWHPDGVQLLIYSQYWTLLLNHQTGHVCEVELIDSENYKPEIINLPPWPVSVQWSPDGNYLAIMLTTHFRLSTLHTDLMVLNFATNERYTLSLGDLVPPYYQRQIIDLMWSPDSRYIAVLALVNRPNSYESATGLFVVEAVTGASTRILPDYLFGPTWGDQLAWHPTGEWLAVADWNGLSLIPVYP